MSAPKVLYEDEHVLVVDKPAGWLTVPTPKKEKKTLHAWAGDQVRAGGGKKAYLVHRLDRETSGALAFAKSVEAQEELERQFRTHEPAREYLALVQGVPRKTRARLTHRLMPHPSKKGIEIVSRNPRFGVEAITEYEIVEVLGGEAALLRVRPVTGRTNQIRVQLAHIGHPLVGERKYAKAGKYRLKAPRTLLHAERLAFIHPVTGREVQVEAPPPEDFEKILKSMRR